MKWRCSKDISHIFDEPTEDYFCPICGYDGFLIGDEEITLNYWGLLELKQITLKDSLVYFLKLFNSEIIIGRDIWKSDIGILDQYLSKIHFKIIKKEKDIYIKDINSKNGLFLNNKKISFEKIKPNIDYFRAGQIRFRIIIDNNLK